MSYAARILDGLVIEVVELPAGVVLADAFHPEAGFVAADETAAVGMSYADGTFGPAPEPAPPTKTDLFAYAANVRFRKETGGIEVAGAPIATDRESQAMISGAFSLVQAQPDTTIRFKTPSGFVTLTAAQMSAIAVAAAQHVQACFALEADIAGDIEAGEISSIEQVDAAFA